jgi:hypothetical protein
LPGGVEELPDLADDLLAVRELTHDPGLHVVDDHREARRIAHILKAFRNVQAVPVPHGAPILPVA